MAKRVHTDAWWWIKADGCDIEREYENGMEW